MSAGHEIQAMFEVAQSVPAPRQPARVAAVCHCGEPFVECRGCGAARCLGCEPVRDDDCMWTI